MKKIKECLKLFLLKKKFRQANIFSPYVSKDAFIGKECTISSNVVIGSTVVLGDYSYVNSDTRIHTAIIGKYCSISYGCKIGLSDHPVDYISTSPHTYADNNIFNEPAFYNEYSRPPVIGNDVWVGANVIILQGVEVGNGSIIGAGAVVTKNVEPYTIVGGVPAKEIKKRFNNEQINYLNRLQWWDLSIDKLNEIKAQFLDIEK